LTQSLGIVLLLLGALEIIGAASGGDRWTQPLRHLAADAHEAAPEFRRIKSLDDLDAALQGSAAAGRASMLDFYADWCVECIRMERNTFPDPGVAALMVNLQLLQADVTPNDAVDQALMKRFGVIGPPAILFFDRQGREMPAFRLVGYFTPEEFSAHLERVLAAP
jgi:thiol:disulfide interchange protein DsbD